MEIERVPGTGARLQLQLSLGHQKLQPQSAPGAPIN